MSALEFYAVIHHEKTITQNFAPHKSTNERVRRAAQQKLSSNAQRDPEQEGEEREVVSVAAS